MHDPGDVNVDQTLGKDLVTLGKRALQKGEVGFDCVSGRRLGSGYTLYVELLGPCRTWQLQTCLLILFCDHDKLCSVTSKT